MTDDYTSKDGLYGADWSGFTSVAWCKLCNQNTGPYFTLDLGKRAARAHALDHHGIGKGVCQVEGCGNTPSSAVCERHKPTR